MTEQDVSTTDDTTKFDRWTSEYRPECTCGECVAYRVRHNLPDPNKRELNKENIDKVIAYLRGDKVCMIRGQRLMYNQSHWFQSGDESSFGSINGSPFESCGTSACIAGFVCLALDADMYERVNAGSDGNYWIQAKATELLGLNSSDADALFTRAPLSYHIYINGRSTHTPHALQAVRVLEHLRDTGKVDWSVAETVDFPRQIVDKEA